MSQRTPQRRMVMSRDRWMMVLAVASIPAFLGLCCGGALLLAGRALFDEAGFYNSRGLEAFNDGEYRLALDDFNRSLELDPNEAEAYYNRGRSHLFLGNFAAAVQDFDNAVTRRFPLPEVFLWRGLAQEKLANPGEAEADFDAFVLEGGAPGEIEERRAELEALLAAPPAPLPSPEATADAEDAG